MPFSENGVHMQCAEGMPTFNAKNLISAPYPLLIHYLTKPLLNIFTDEKWAFLSISTLFATLNAIFTYFCTASLCNSKIALFAASALLWLPLTITASRIYILDYPQATCITLWFLCYLKSKRFTRYIPSIGFVLLIVISLLFKYTYFTYIIPCFIGMVYHTYQSKSKSVLKKKHIAASALPHLFAVYLYFADNWIAAIKAVGLILLFEGPVLYKKDRGLGKLYFLAGLGLTASIYFFSHYADASILNNIAFQERINISSNVDFTNISPKYYLSCLSLISLSVLHVIRAKLLTPLLFWYFVIGTILITTIPRLRHKYLILVAPLTVCPLYLLFTHAEDRFQSPMMAFFCMIAAIWLDGKRFHKIKSFLYIAGITAITFYGAYISGGWLTNNTDRLPAFLLTAGCGKEEISAKPQGYIAQKNGKNVYRIGFPKNTTCNNFFSLSSQWSDNFLYTFDTYNIDWLNCLKPIMQLPDGTAIQIKYLHIDDSKEEFREPGILENVIKYYASKNGKNIIISNKGQYILRIQTSLDSKRKKAIRILEKKLSQQLSAEADCIKSWNYKDYAFTLYKRKMP
ncbi:MAG: glycosyltransferase family 39 protein [bacterium]|nr:glycosyltransferase family 39 protein [bacterium]